MIDTCINIIQMIPTLIDLFTIDNNKLIKPIQTSNIIQLIDLYVPYTQQQLIQNDIQYQYMVVN